jgi:hypothetical protein
LEEIAFEVVSTQSEPKVVEKAEVMHHRGVRRIFGIWVKGRRRVCEWSAGSGSWRLLDEGSQIEDSCLATPLPVKALLDAALVRRAVPADQKGKQCENVVQFFCVFGSRSRPHH